MQMNETLKRYPQFSDLQKHKFLVTGATGFIGSWVLHRLLESGVTEESILVLTRNKHAAEFLKTTKIHIIEGQITAPDKWELPIIPDVLIHLAANVADWPYNPEPFEQANVIAVDKLKEQCAQWKCKFIYVSTVDIFGTKSIGSLISRDSDFAGSEVNHLNYVRTKRESTAKLFNSFNSDLTFSRIYPAWVYGPPARENWTSDKTFIPEVIKVTNSRLPVYLGKGENPVPLSFVGNVADVILLTIVTPIANKKGYIVRDAEDISWKQFTDMVFNTLNLKPILGFRYISVMPIGLAKCLTWIFEKLYGLFKIKSRPLYTRYVLFTLGIGASYDISHTINELGYNPLPQTEALQSTLKWFQKDKTLKDK
jgi:nucleoside-diphosphate-sugar epimerase